MLHDHFDCPYSKTAVTFGKENINLSNVVDNKGYYGHIFNNEDIKDFVDEDNKINPCAINYEKELCSEGNYPILKPLKNGL